MSISVKAIVESDLPNDARLPEAMQIVLGKPPSHSLSQPLYRYFDENRQYMTFFRFVNDLASRADANRITAAKALLSVQKDDHPDASHYKETIANPTYVTDILRRYADVQSRNLVVATVNNFLCYFSEIIQAAMLKRPELLRSGSTVRVDEVLSFRKKADVVSYLIGKQINDLSYGGVLRMEEYVRDRLGIETFATPESKNALILFIEIRNIHTHNRGIVNDLFLQRVRDHLGYAFKRGEQANVDFDMFAHLADNTHAVASRMDESISRKFKIPRKKFVTWRAGGKRQRLSRVNE